MATRVTPFHNTTDGGGSGTTQGSNSISVNAGDLICIFVKHEGAPTTISLGDNKSNTWTSRAKVDHSGGGLSGELFTAVANGTYADLVVTATFAASRNWKGLWFHAYRPTGASLSFDTVASAQGTGTAIATGSLSISTAGGAGVCFVAGDGGVTYTAGSGWTEQMDSGDYSEDRLTAGSEGTINGQATASGSQNWLAIAMHLAEPGGTPGGIDPGIIHGSATIIGNPFYSFG